MKNLPTHLDQIIGLPEDTKETAEKSFNEILALGPDEFQMGFLKILPGTALSQKTGKYGMIVNPAPPYEVIQTSTMNYREMKYFYKIETELNRFHNSHYFIETLAFLMKERENPLSFFAALQEFSPEDNSVKRWALLGESLVHYGEKYHREESEYISDLLRKDWCPYASGQSFPPFLKKDDNELIKELRRQSYPLFSEIIKDFTRRDFNHSILYVPYSERMKKELNQKIILFYRGENVDEYSISLEKIL
jgi:anaerobic magnesium-protoporphyrin IX monomethyl ester cyclase